MVAYPSFLIAFARRDFFREAEFFLMTPFLAALSSALYARTSASLVPALVFAMTSFLTFFTVLAIVSLTARLTRRFRLEDLRAFFADDVIGMKKN